MGSSLHYRSSYLDECPENWDQMTRKEKKKYISNEKKIQKK